MLKASALWAAVALPLFCGLGGIGNAVAQQQQTPPPLTAPPKVAPAPPPAAPLPAAQNLTVMVVDAQALLQESKAAKMVRAQIEQKRSEYAKEISQEEEMLRSERDSLQRQQASLSPEALNKKGREFQQKVNELDRSVQAKRQALEKSNNDALSKIQQQMLKIIADIAKQRKANLVLQRTELVLFDRVFDVTDEVMQKLDEQMPVLTVNFVNPQPPPAAMAAPPPPAPTPRTRRR
jgi:Skp family chaperone for outer membrane proteins